jgi:nondiscriminating aspartyl-tRNA synthetase
MTDYYFVSEIKTLPWLCDDAKITLMTRIDNIREISKKMWFIIFRDGLDTLQGVLYNKEGIEKKDWMSRENIVIVSGKISTPKEEIKATTIHDIEIQIEDIHPMVEHVDSPSIYLPCPLSCSEKDKDAIPEISLSKKLDHRYLDLRSCINHSIFKIQHCVTESFRRLLSNQGFAEIHTPKLIKGATESGATVFPVKYFDGEAFLAQSPQLYKQMAINSDFRRVFEVGPVFRAEKSFTRKHLTEFTGLDFEMRIKKDYHEINSIMHYLITSIIDSVQKFCGDELKIIKTAHDFELPVVSATPTIIKYVDGLSMLGYEDKLYQINDEDELKLGKIIKEKYGTDLYILDEYPMSMRPFYTQPSDVAGYTNSYDMFLRGKEISSGAQRINDYYKLLANLEHKGIDPKSLGGYVESFKYGSYPHGGAGFGLERIVQYILDLDNIRMTSLFPRDPSRLFP